VNQNLNCFNQLNVTNKKLKDKALLVTFLDQRPKTQKISPQGPLCERPLGAKKALLSQQKGFFNAFSAS
jgi:hypothetical protein